ncbi:ABC transporter ATP-binding protein [Nocardioides marmoriginsengisoli]|uniref:ABC transporter ATP-binding protein n=1 Tax=Nocardioides marmoriginsengisoli TaxID=661483 RepID=A0A3N0CPH6_9ACTN|nr:ABC transporter ATP-binding protein [Nocardioides marmoriginsengisoli]RNL65372.1 ABC transporter ATP-binding protein [Nocardioides marmoriginsengisoli]
MLELTGVSSGYGAVPVLHGVDLTITAGEVVTVLGANGAGKTTLARTISGLLPVKEGSIRLDGTDLTRKPLHRRAGRGVILVPEGRRLFGGLTVAQNIELGRIAAKGRQQDADAVGHLLDAFPKVRTLWDRQAGLLSGGEQQMVALARAAAGRPRVLLLDEPSLGLSPLLVDEVFAMVTFMARETGSAVLLIEQIVDGALAVADRGVVMAHGQIVAAGTASELSASPAVRQAYLGGAGLDEAAR